MEYNDFEELAKLAYKNEELSDFAPLPTKYMYLKLNILYNDFAKGKYTKEQCINTKNLLRNEYKNIMQEHTRDMECYREYLKNRRENTELLIKIEKESNKDILLDTCLKIISNCVNDKSLLNRNKMKWKQLDF